MGYHSSIVIGAHKEVILRDLISSEIPEYLRNEPPKQEGDFFYWDLNWKWYEIDPGIVEVTTWFSRLAEEDETRMLEGDPERPAPPRFGALRIGDDAKDMDEWGYPGELDIYSVSYINCPGRA